MTERIVEPDGVRLCLETFGALGDPAVLLIAGMAMPLDGWDDELCERLAGAGRYVVRYDHRDTGRSQTSPPGRPGYTAGDLEADAVRVLDALGIARAHLVGISMGGGIAQVLAVRHPERVRSLTLVATSAAGTRDDPAELPSPDPRLGAAYANLATPDWSDADAVVEYVIAAGRPLRPAVDEDRLRRAAERTVRRAVDPAAMTNHEHVVGGGDGTAFRMTDIAVPTLVVHGSGDPLFPLPHGEALAAAIPGARLLVLPGVGHEVPPPDTWDTVVPAITALTASA